MLDPVDRHFRAAVLADKDLVALLDLERNDLALVGDPALAGLDDLGFLGLFLGGVGDDDASPLDFLFFQPLQKNTVMQRLNLHTNLHMMF